MKVLLIGVRPPGAAPPIVSSLDIDAVARRLQPNHTFVRRCAGAEDFADAVKHAGARRLVDRLDILDHGAEGIQAMGDAVLWKSDAAPESALVGRELALDIKPYLSETAQIRLLGCSTAKGRAGRLLLLKLGRVLGPYRTVFGMIDRVVEDDFDAEGYAPALEHQRIFSSSAALEGEAPSSKQRLENLRAAQAVFL